MAPNKKYKTYGRANNSLVNNSIDAFNVLFLANPGIRKRKTKKKIQKNLKYIDKIISTDLPLTTNLVNDSLYASTEDAFDKLKKSSTIIKPIIKLSRPKSKSFKKQSITEQDSYSPIMTRQRSRSKNFDKKSLKICDMTDTSSEDYISKRMKEPSREHIVSSLEIEQAYMSSNLLAPGAFQNSHNETHSNFNSSKLGTSNHTFSNLLPQAHSEMHSNFDCSKLGTSILNFSNLLPQARSTPMAKGKNARKQENKENVVNNQVKVSQSTSCNFITLRNKKVIMSYSSKKEENKLTRRKCYGDSNCTSEKISISNSNSKVSTRLYKSDTVNYSGDLFSSIEDSKFTNRSSIGFPIRDITEPKESQLRNITNNSINSFEVLTKASYNSINHNNNQIIEANHKKESLIVNLTKNEFSTRNKIISGHSDIINTSIDNIDINSLSKNCLDVSTDASCDYTNNKAENSNITNNSIDSNKISNKNSTENSIFQNEYSLHERVDSSENIKIDSSKILLVNLTQGEFGSKNEMDLDNSNVSKSNENITDNNIMIEDKYENSLPKHESVDSSQIIKIDDSEVLDGTNNLIASNNKKQCLLVNLTQGEFGLKNEMDLDNSNVSKSNENITDSKAMFGDKDENSLPIQESVDSIQIIKIDDSEVLDDSNNVIASNNNKECLLVNLTQGEFGSKNEMDLDNSNVNKSNENITDSNIMLDEPKYVNSLLIASNKRRRSLKVTLTRMKFDTENKIDLKQSDLNKNNYIKDSISKKRLTEGNIMSNDLVFHMDESNLFKLPTTPGGGKKWKRKYLRSSLLDSSFIAEASVRKSVISCYVREPITEESLEDSIRCLSLNQRNSINKSQFTVVEPISARDIVLRKCGQTKPLEFSKCFPDSVLQNCHKIGEGVYGEVFLFKNPNGGTSVIKIVPIEGDQIVNGERQKKFEEILSEIIITMELSNLRNNKRNGIQAFTKVEKIQCVQGRYPEKLIDLWELFDETQKSENDCPDIFNEDQLYIVFQMANGGSDLESFLFQDAQQAFASFQQIAIGLAAAEEELHFEHRDLHWGNILISKVNKNKVITFNLDNETYDIPTMGVEVAIIDFTLSRIEHNGIVIFNDLSLDPDLFVSEGDYQFEIYRLMQQKIGNNWKKFEPFTNLLWLHYVLDKMINGINYVKKNAATKRHKFYTKKLIEMKDDILRYHTVKDFVKVMFLE